MILFCHPTGPLLVYKTGFLHIADLNPELSTRWRMSRFEMLALGWRCIVAALKAKP